MALILSLETSTTLCSVALSLDGKTIACKELNDGYTHAENSTLFIQDVLTIANKTLNNVDAIAVGKGPGSYTGLRIGASTAKGLCYSLKKPLIAIDSLLIMANAVSSIESDALICPMIDARRMEVYTALFSAEKKQLLETCAMIIDHSSFAEELKTQKIYFIGNGAEKCKPIFANNTNAFFIDTIYPSAKEMASIADQMFLQKKFVDAAYFEPNYVKDFYTPTKK
ncbi:MAG: tRNA (adenosine(37)-N6)-threonylcarbamoyltransferase complex dimerization subunit type 1 TsaB [Bacteroidetes bacterium]|nr:tRNA (adenosine(37)-N6)-threonylcarbamoyltransferase complex dimerization subunit type 1 TsaB [Bacteroidota bacterium]